VSEAREAVLGRIRAALGEASAEPAAAAWARISREYRRSGAGGEGGEGGVEVGGSSQAALTLLEERLRDYDAVVERVTAAELPAAMDRALLKVAGRVLVATGFVPDWLPAMRAVEWDAAFSARQLDGFEAVLTGATLAIAETGTLVLQGVAGQGRRAATLVPDVHLCTVRMRDVVATVPEAIARLEGTATLPTTFVSGPSATADIEMTRIKGVHGPRFLHVFLLDG